MVNPTRALLTAAAMLTALHLAPRAAWSQQVDDRQFDATVARPAFASPSKRLVIDEGHRNFHTTEIGYMAFASLMKNDGYAVGVSKAMFTAATLPAADVLVIVNAGSAGASRSVRMPDPAFTSEECDALRDWVRAGGALLLIADHFPYGSAAAALAERFGVDFGGGWVSDAGRALAPGNPTALVFSEALLGSSPILQGRDQSERVRRVVAFTGQSMSVPTGGTALLRLSDSAVEYRRDPAVAPTAGVPVAGRAQGVSFTFGLGRVVILGEASMLTAQRAVRPTDPEGAPMLVGMNLPGFDNKQFALNVVRWLAGVLN